MQKSCKFFFLELPGFPVSVAMTRRKLSLTKSGQSAQRSLVAIGFTLQNRTVLPWNSSLDWQTMIWGIFLLLKKFVYIWHQQSKNLRNLNFDCGLSATCLAEREEAFIRGREWLSDQDKWKKCLNSAADFGFLVLFYTVSRRANQKSKRSLFDNDLFLILFRALPTLRKFQNDKAGSTTNSCVPYLAKDWSLYNNKIEKRGTNL